MKSIYHLIVRVLPIIAVVLVILQILASNELASMGKSTYAIDQQVDQLREENARLTQQIAASSSLLVIEERAVTLGFVKNTAFLSLGPAEVAFGKAH